MSDSPNNDTVTFQLERSTARTVALVLGILGLVVGVIALLVDGGISGDSLVPEISLAVGVVGLIVWVMLDPQAIVSALTGRQARYASNSFIMSLAFIAILVTVYALLLDLEETADWMTIDVTEDKQFSLSDLTTDLLASLDEPVHVIGFYPDNFSRDDAELILKEYQQKSNGQLTYEFFDPDLRPGLAQQYDVTRSNVLVFTQGDRTAEATFADEQNMTSALERVLAGEIQKAYLLTGHGERAADGFDDGSLQRAVDKLNSGNFEVDSLNLLETGEIPEDASLLIIAGPTTQYRQEEMSLIRAFSESGGPLMVMVDPSITSGVRTSGVQGIAYSPDGDFVVTAGSDDLAKVWDASTREELASLDAHTNDVLSVAVSPDSQTIATASADQKVILWNADGDMLNTLEGHQDTVWRVAFSPDGALLASASFDQSINLWNVETGEVVQTLFAQTPAVDIAFSPDSQLIAASFQDGSVRVWNIKGEEVASQRPHTDIVFGVAFSPDGSTVMSASADGTLATLDVSSGVATQHTVLDATLPLTDVIYLNGDQVAFAAVDFAIHVWDSALTEEQYVLQTDHTDAIWQLALSPDGATLATASADGSDEFWNLEDQEQIETLRGHTGGDPLQTYLFSSWNIRLNDDIVVEPSNVVFDEFTPTIFQYNTHPITTPTASSNLPTFFPAARSIDFATPDTPETLTLTPLVFTSSQSWGETNPNLQAVSLDTQDIPGPLVLAMTGENSETGARLVVFGDADFATNGGLAQEGFGNLEMFVNSANWLVEEEDLINIQPRSSTFRSFTPMSPPITRMVFFGLVCIIPLGMVIIGGTIWAARRRRR